MRTLALLGLLLLLALPGAAATRVAGELTSDAPVTLLGDGVATGRDLALLHYAFAEGSLAGRAYSGTLVERIVAHLQPPQQNPTCNQFEGQQQSYTRLAADSTKYYDLIDYHLKGGALARIGFPNEARFSATEAGASRDLSKPFALLGPNPYRYRAGAAPAADAAPDSFAPAFPTGGFVVVPTETLHTVGPVEMTLEWGVLEAKQRDRTQDYSAGIVPSTRTVTDGTNPLQPTTVTCTVDEVHTYEFDQSIVVLTLAQEGADRPARVWARHETPDVAAAHAYPAGYWSRRDGPAFATGLDQAALPATVFTSPDFTMRVQGAARFERALGTLTGDGVHDEVKDQGVRLVGDLGLTPLSSDDGHRMTTRVGNDLTAFAVDGANGPKALLAAAPWIAGGLAGVALVGVGLWRTPVARFEATKWLLTPLYARLRKEDLLENPLRDDILEVVERSPGISASELGRRLECGWGTLVYHLTVLERMQLLSSAREGRHKRFFVQGRINYSDKGAVGLLANPAARLVLDAIREAPGSIQRDLSRRVGLSPGTIAWHVERLSEAGLVLKEEEGRVVRYYPSQRLLELTRQLAA